MAEEVLKGIFRIAVPLPKNPLKATNSYVIMGERNLIVDTGFDRDDCWDVLSTGLEELDVDLDRTDLFITHLHADHVGLARRLSREGMHLYFNEPDATWFRRSGIWDNMLSFLRLNGFPEGELVHIMERHPGYRYSGDRNLPFEFMDDGDVIRVGDRTLRCIRTPGHTAGHTCLYDERDRLLIAGDHVLGDITPNIWLYSFDTDPLGDYLSSLDRVAELEMDVILPGHRSIITDPQVRIRDLRDHYLGRLKEVRGILKAGPLTGYEVASRMSWDIRADDFESFPTMQKWFATGEALANVRYLMLRDGVEMRREGEGPVLFGPV